jgi:hypothetical protein
MADHFHLFSLNPSRQHFVTETATGSSRATMILFDSQTGLIFVTADNFLVIDEHRDELRHKAADFNTLSRRSLLQSHD